MNLKDLINHFCSDIESGIVTGCDGTLESLLRHLDESFGDCGGVNDRVRLVVGGNIYNGFICENEIAIVKHNDKDVLGIVKLAFDGPIFEWGEKIVVREDVNRQEGMWIIDGEEEVQLFSYSDE